MLRVHIVWSGDRAVRMRGACIDITERRAVDDLLGRTQAELGQQVADLHRLHELSSRLLDTRTLSEQLQMILVALADFHGARRGVLTLFDTASGTLGIDASTGFTPDAVARLMQTSGIDGACAICCARRERTVIDDTEADDVDPGLRALASEEGFRAVHATPLIGQDGEVIGALSIHLDAPHAPTERERTLADICARKAATFIERARAQAAYQESQGRFQAVLDASAVPFVVLSPVREDTSGAHRRLRVDATSTTPPRRRCAARPTRSRAGACRTCCRRAGRPATRSRSTSAVVETERDARVRDARALRRPRAVVPLRRLADARQRRAVVHRHHHAQERRARCCRRPTAARTSSSRRWRTSCATRSRRSARPARCRACRRPPRRRSAGATR